MNGESNPATSPPKKRPRPQRLQTAPPRSISNRRPPSGKASSDDVNKSRSPSAHPPANMRSFAQLIGSGRSRAEQVLGDHAPDDAWANIANTLDNLGSASLPPPTRDSNDPPRQKSHQDPDPEASAEMLGTLENAREVQLDAMILDLTLKTRMQIVSAYSLRWSLCRGQGAEYEALQDIMRCDRDGDNALAKMGGNGRKRDGSDVSKRDMAKAKKQFYEALINFQYPSGPLPAKIGVDWIALTANYGKTSWQTTPATDPQKLCVNRLLHWQDALQSLFYGYRYGHVSEFYLILPTTTVLFTRGLPLKTGKQDDRVQPDAHADSSVSACLRACFSRASVGLQSLMGDYQVPFSIVEGTDGFEEPCVVVEGPAEVHLLYNFFAAVGHKISNAMDVPTIIADKPFRGCTVIGAEVRNARSSIVARKRGEPDEEKYSLQIRGILTPRQVRRICNSLAVIQNRDLEMRVEADSKGSMLNMCGHGRKDASNQEEQERFKLRGPYILSRIRVSSDINGYAFASTDAH